MNASSKWFIRVLHSEGLRAMQHRNYRLFIFGQLVSLIGTWMQSTAQQWLVYSITNSQFKLGVVSFAGFFPILLISLFMGPIVDRLPRRTILLATQTLYMILAAILAVLTALHIVQYWHIVILALLLGFVSALDMPARQAFYIDLVAREDLLNAIAINSSVFNAARIFGPAAAGIVVAAVGEAPAFAINSISYLAVIFALLRISIPPGIKSDRKGSGTAQLKEGLLYLVRTREVFGLVTMVAIFSLLGFPYLILLPAVAVEVLNTGPEGFSALVSAQGVGALIGAVLLAGFGNHIHKGRILLISRFTLSASLVVLGFSRVQFISQIALVFAGFSFITSLALTNTLIQIIVPDKIRGRVLSAFTWALGGFLPIGSLVYGSIGDAIGVAGAILIASGFCLLAAIVSLKWFPETGKLR
ncbi:MAG: MFS transporter [Anaerolineales bacterium]|nr:MFS transporter [Anaerolineales bacterium]